MPHNFEAPPGRVQLSFATEGLTAREELLLKSLIRLLDHRTHQQWDYTAHLADIWLVAQGCKVPQTAFSRDKQPKVLTFSPTTEVSAQAQLARPFNANQIEAALNHIGAILAAQVVGHTQSTMVETYRLIRWPTALVQGNPKHIMIASVLLGKPMSLQEITKQSGSTQNECLQFINALKIEQLVTVKQNYLEQLSPGTSPAIHHLYHMAHPQPLPSLFARIRSRLTLKKTT
jgi:hypothetical protein